MDCDDYLSQHELDHYLAEGPAEYAVTDTDEVLREQVTHYEQAIHFLLFDEFTFSGLSRSYV